MPEREAVAALDKHPRVNELLHRAEQCRRQSVEHVGEVGEREPAAERGGNRGGLPSGRGDGAQTLAHREPDAAGQARLDQLGPTADDADQVLVPQARQQLDEHERAAVRALDEVEERVVGLGVHDVFGHLGHGGLAEWAEDDPLSAATVQMRDRDAEMRRALLGPEGNDPGDRQVGEADGQRKQRRRGATVGPLLVVERDQQRPVERRALEQRL